MIFKCVYYIYRLCRHFRFSELSPQEVKEMWHLFKTPFLNKKAFSRFFIRNQSSCINTWYTNIFAFTSFHLRGQTNAIFLYVPRSVIYQDIFKKSSKCRVEKLYLDFSFILYIREFKHMWYQRYQSDYCLKHFKLVCMIFSYLYSII